MLVPLCRDVTVKPMVLEAALPQCLVKTFTTALDAMVQVRAADALKALLKTASASTLMALQPLMSPLRALASDGSRLRVNVRPYAIEALGYMAMNDELAAQLVEQGTCFCAYVPQPVYNAIYCDAWEPPCDGWHPCA